MRTVTIIGLAETVEVFRTLQRRETRRIVRRGLRAGARHIAWIMRREAPRLTGNLKKSIGVIPSRPKNKDVIRMMAGPRTKFFPSFYYPAAVNAGHRVRHSRQRIKANDFLTRAYLASASQAASTATGVIENDIARIASSRAN